ncbi:hypothetical protein [Neobacillus niacini]|uniref:hypothetical protein n=1 Tax=Neobacillus niacini TaxID=86668 RepID=UPI00286C265C|nr:hypothetical protein [Neobacillus niacini]
MQNLDTANELYHDWSLSFRTWYERNKHEERFSGIRVDSAGLILTLLNTPGKWGIVPLSKAKSWMTLGTFSIYELEDPPPERVYYQVRPRYPSKCY